MFHAFARQSDGHIGSFDSLGALSDGANMRDESIMWILTTVVAHASSTVKKKLPRQGSSRRSGRTVKS